MLQRYAQFCKAESSLQRCETCCAASLRELHRDGTLLANAKPELMHTRQGSSGQQMKDAHAHLYMSWSDPENSDGSDKPLILTMTDSERYCTTVAT